MPLGELTEKRRRAMKARLNPALTREVFAPLPWSTGLCDLWTDPELLYTSSHGLCGLCGFVCLPAKTFVELLNGANVWTRQHHGRAEDSIRGAMGAKFSSPSLALLWNALVLAIFPPIRVYWRWRLRQQYVVRGALWGDCFAVSLCYFCSAMQEQREIRIEQDPMFAAVHKIDGAHLPTNFLAAYGQPTDLPNQEQMNSPKTDASADGPEDPEGETAGRDD
mmetsp:Transcript_50968/g.103641  ORF Transcript_50968/g.103641 Transcript_50968/m.103641 type:complete len:221 (-) Transcript_50968:431-1093(-)